MQPSAAREKKNPPALTLEMEEQEAPLLEELEEPDLLPTRAVYMPETRNRHTAEQEIGFVIQILESLFGRIAEHSFCNPPKQGLELLYISKAKFCGKCWIKRSLLFFWSCAILVNISIRIE